MVGYFISFYTNEDTLHVVMSEKSGDRIFLDIFKSKTNNMSVVITEMKLNGSKWSEMKWHEMMWLNEFEMKWKWNEIKQDETTWMNEMEKKGMR